MNIRHAYTRLALAVGIAGLASCGGGGGSSATPSGGTSKTPIAQTVAVTFNIVIPRPAGSSSSRRPQYISASTASASISINAGAPTTVPCTTTCSATVDAPVGLDAFAVSLHDASSNLLSQGSVSHTISATAANVVNIAFGGQVATIHLTSTIANLVPGTLATIAPVTVTALDADNNTIVGSDPYLNPIVLGDSDGSGATALSTTSVTSPATVVTMTYSGVGSLAGGSATITPTALGTSGNTPVTFNVYAHHTILEYPIPGNSLLDAVATGSDGNLWFVDQNVAKVGYVTPAGAVQEFPTSAGAANMAKGSDGNIWFTELTAIGRVTPGGTVTEFSGLSDSQPEGITAGPGGDLFFAEFGSTSPGRVGKITTGGTITESAQISTPPPPQLQGIAEGSDGRLWITEPFPFPGALFLDAMDSSFGLTRYVIPINAQLRAITNGSDGNLWIVDDSNNVIDKVSTTAGIFLNQYPIPGSGPEGIASGVDGNLYFGEFGSNDIASITTGGTTATFAIPTAASGVNSVTSGPDGNIWFSEGTAGKIGRFIL
jgi:virginiamycin B lyase